MKQDRIDNYILGEMSNEERLAFEQEMSQDKNLQEEVALQRDIVRAIRLKAAKEHLQAVEREIQAKEQREMQAKERRRQVFIVKLSNVARLVAACLIIGVIAGSSYYYVDTVNTYRDCGLNIQSEILAERGGARGEEKCSDRAITAMANGDYKLALDIIEEGESIKFAFDDPNSTLREQALLEFKFEQEDLQWFKAVTYMRMGKWVKAKRLLKEIAASDSYYKTKAEKALEEL
mgnify:CR=1 FL=1